MCASGAEPCRRPRRLALDVESLTNEYMGMSVVLRDGTVTELPALTEREEIEFPMPAGRCEAFLTSGGTSTAPWTFGGELESYEYKTVRNRGHLDHVRLLVDLGYLGTEPVKTVRGEVVPRDLTHALLERTQSLHEDPDLVVLRVECAGEAADAYRIDLLDLQDAATGFTALERSTAFPAAIVTYLQASGAVDPGARPLEVAVPAERFLSLLDRRGFKIVHARL